MRVTDTQTCVLYNAASISNMTLIYATPSERLLSNNRAT